MPFRLDEPKKKGRDLVRLIEGDVLDMRRAVSMRRFIRNLYYGMRLRRKRYKGQSDIHLYVMAEKIEGIVAKEMNAFWAIEPHAHAQRVRPETNSEETKAAEKIVNWGADVDIPDFYSTFESWLRNRHLDSVAAVKIWYNQEQRHTVVIEEADTMWQVGDTDLVSIEVKEKRPKVPHEILASVFAQVVVLESKRGDRNADPLEDQVPEGLEFVIDFVEGRTDYKDIRVEFRPSRFVDTIELAIHRPVFYKDNVEVDNVEFEDLLLPFRARGLQPDGSERLAQKYWLTVSEIEKRRNLLTQDRWDINDDEMVTLRNRSRGQRHEERVGGFDDRLKGQKDLVTGQIDTQRTSRTVDLKPYVDDKVMIFEVYATEDLHGDGIFSEVIYQIPYGIEKVVHSQYLEELYPHGHRPFADVHSIRLSNRYYGWSLGQVLAPINLEVDAIVNSVNDAQELINNPFWFHTPLAVPKDQKRTLGLRPGQAIEIQDINGIFFPKFQQEPLANLSMVDTLLNYADRMTISPQALGSSNVRNSPRTARGTLALLSEAGIKVDNYITAAQKGGWSELMYQIYALYDSFASEETWEKVTGFTRPARSKSADLRNRVKFWFKGNTVNTNREVMRGMAQIVYNTVMTNPLYATDPQALRNVTEFFLNHFVDSGDAQRLLPTQPAGFTRRAMSPREENELMASGVPLDALPGDDHGTHLAGHMQFQGSKRFGDITDAEVALFAAHVLQHQRMQQLQLQQGAVSAGGQSNNIPLEIGRGQNVLES